MRQAVAIVDSDAASLRILRGLLSALDVDVTVYDNAAKYLARTPGADAPACVIVDAKLSDMSGVQLLKQIRSTDHDLPVILMASEADVTVAVEAMRHGATDFIEKPELDVALLRRVSQLLRNGAEHHAAR